MKNINKKGFTLIETILAVAVLVIGFTGVMLLVSSSVSLSRMDRQKSTAMALAQEGLEIARIARANNVFICEEGLSSNYYHRVYIIPENAGDVNIASGDNNNLYDDFYMLQRINGNRYNGYFVHDAGEGDSGFYRMIELSNDDVIEDYSSACNITSWVGWETTNGEQKKVGISTVLTNWTDDL